MADRGLEGDRSAAKPPSRPGGGKRQVTLIQAEHMPLIGLWTRPRRRRRRPAAQPRRFRRQPARAASLFADQPLQVRLGPDVLIVVTGPCDPCSKMEALLGPGGYNAMRGHGGTTARVIHGGVISVGDAVVVEPARRRRRPGCWRRERARAGGRRSETRHGALTATSAPAIRPLHHHPDTL